MTDGEDTPGADETADASGAGGSADGATTGGTAIRRDRFSGGPARGFMSSLAADERIFAADLQVDRAHTVMLAEQGIVDDEDAAAILDALDDVEAAGHGELPDAEDVHEAIETAVIQRVGPEGGRMHTARSRNDEVATCIRYRLRADIFEALETVVGAREQLLDAAESHTETVMPGFTHLQYAQPVTVAHWILSYEGPLARDTERLLAALDTTNQSPLGAAAFAGTPFDVDRERTAELLGFDGTVANSMDATSSRDFLVETTSALTTLATMLSGMAEDLVVYSGRDYLEISDDYASTSSIMPQKKNPDTLEIVRATAGEAQGALQRLLTTLKGLPRSYNIDLQEATPPAWTAVDSVPPALEVATGALTTAEWHEDVLAAEAAAGFSTATGVADRLAMAGVPFRTAHEVVATVAEDLDPGQDAPEIAELEAAAEGILGEPLTAYVDAETLEATLDPVESVAMRDSAGGPAPEAVATQIEEARERLAADEDAVAERTDAVATALDDLESEVADYV
ncbi:argininosuccinate lyase [Halosimplex pelagicum]|uniref:Argininosuccinate lyase n=1 Tax=Halosimplex pelagicum TaxID=869886 RepID=A0A7D5T8F5_9EURY|nr:argininosuccinate lyase [Halosimplex pelagicum]QLH80910.1 argininosuccinate lyase [Halosimplex pelagicum]